MHVSSSLPSFDLISLIISSTSSHSIAYRCMESIANRADLFRFPPLPRLAFAEPCVMTLQVRSMGNVIRTDNIHMHMHRNICASAHHYKYYTPHSISSFGIFGLPSLKSSLGRTAVLPTTVFFCFFFFGVLYPVLFTSASFYPLER